MYPDQNFPKEYIQFSVKRRGYYHLVFHIPGAESSTLVTMRYVHELQNLFFAHYKKELVLQ